MTALATTLSLSEFTSHCSKVISDMQHSKKTIVLTKYGEPIAKVSVIPMQPKKKIKKEEFFGSFKGRFDIVGDIVSPIEDELGTQK